MSDDLVKRLRDGNTLDIGEAADLIEALEAEVGRLREALTRLRDCDWVITLPDRMDAVREIARKALEDKQ